MVIVVVVLPDSNQFLLFYIVIKTASLPLDLSADFLLSKGNGTLFRIIDPTNGTNYMSSQGFTRLTTRPYGTRAAGTAVYFLLLVSLPGEVYWPR